MGNWGYDKPRKKWSYFTVLITGDFGPTLYTLVFGGFKVILVVFTRTLLLPECVMWPSVPDSISTMT